MKLFLLILLVLVFGSCQMGSDVVARESNYEVRLVEQVSEEPIEPLGEKFRGECSVDSLYENGEVIWFQGAFFQCDDCEKGDGLNSENWLFIEGGSEVPTEYSVYQIQGDSILNLGREGQVGTHPDVTGMIPLPFCSDKRMCDYYGATILDQTTYGLSYRNDTGWVELKADYLPYLSKSNSVSFVMDYQNPDSTLQEVGSLEWMIFLAMFLKGTMLQFSEGTYPLHLDSLPEYRSINKFSSNSWANVSLPVLELKGGWKGVNQWSFHQLSLHLTRETRIETWSGVTFENVEISSPDDPPKFWANMSCVNNVTWNEQVLNEDCL